MLTENKYIQAIIVRVKSFPLPGKVVLGLWIVILVQSLSLSLRNYGFVHPDEIFQSLEIAHSIVYGSGIIPPEFQKNPASSYSMSRSPLFPYIFVVVFWVGKVLGWDYWSQTLVALKVLLGINASLVFLSMYKFVTVIQAKDEKHSWEGVGTVIALFFTWEVMYFAIRSLVNSFFSPLLFYSLAKYLEEARRKELRVWQQSVWIVILTLLVYVRPDFAIILGMVVLSQVPNLISPARGKLEGMFAVHVFSVVLGISIGGWIDYTYYGMYLVSPIHWYQFNIVENQSSIFGVEPWDYYFQYLWSIKIIKYGIVFAIILDVLDFGFSVEVKNSEMTQRIRISPRGIIALQRLSILVTSVFALLVYSRVDHKETRFIYNILLLVISYIGTSVTTSIHTSFFVNNVQNTKIPRKQGEQERRMIREGKAQQKGRNIGQGRVKHLGLWKRQLMGVLLISLLLIPLNVWYTQDQRDHELSPFHDVIEGVMYVGQQPDSTGVLVLVYWYLTGGYTYLHKDIPMETLMRLDNAYELFRFMQIIYNQSSTFNYVVMPWFQYFAYHNMSRADLEHAGYEIVFQVQSTDVWRYVGS